MTDRSRNQRQPAMASFVDSISRSSSPDPLGDELPSSMRPVTRRMTRNTLQPPSSLQSFPQVTPGIMSSAARRSPRKQTFELDVGNELSPQKILVTVEAEHETSRLSGVNRRLFTTSSPTRNVNQRHEITTTTLVPLRGLTDDEGGDLGNEATPRRRGRTPGSKNKPKNTPKPRAKKRSGTPIRKTPRVTRRRIDRAESETSMFSDAPAERDAGEEEPTPKPKPKARKKTSEKLATPDILSSISTVRKRGRPRKVRRPEEVSVVTDAASEAGGYGDGTEVAQSEGLRSIADMPSEMDLDSAGLKERRSSPAISSPTPSVLPGASQASDLIEGSVDDVQTDDFNGDMSDDYVADPQSDFESEVDEGNNHPSTRQDTLAHASDFSMIAIDSLPSFQASLHADKTNIDSEPHFSQEVHDVGEETNLIINRTLESLRGDIQAETHSEASNTGDFEEQSAKRAFPVPNSSRALQNVSNTHTWSSSPSQSPRKQKQMPLSRQVFAHKSLVVDDSFSTLPDSVLQAATPGQPSMKPASANMEDDTDMHDDSFSEIPDVVLEDATPKPPPRSAKISTGNARKSPEVNMEAPSTGKIFSSLSSSRLPTPDNTSSSGAGSKSSNSDQKQKYLETTSVNGHNTSDFNFRSSPPVLGHESRAEGRNAEHIHSEQSRAGVSYVAGSSPQLPLGPLDGHAKQSKSLQPPAPVEPLVPARRPTLSPIMRVGRTLQNIMSDHSSPEGRRSSLGSPFRGSPKNDSHPSFMVTSPAHGSHKSFGHFKSESMFDPLASFTQNIRSNFGQVQTQPPAHVVKGKSDDAFEPDVQDYSPMQSVQRTTAEPANTNAPSTPPRPVSATSSTQVAPPSDDEITAANESSPTAQRLRRLSASQHLAAKKSSILGTRGSTSTRKPAMEVAEEQAEKQATEDDDQVIDEEGEGQDDHDVDEDDEEQEEQVQDTQVEDDVDEHDEENDHRDANMEGNVADNADDEFDMWDIEASRDIQPSAPTPRSTKTLRAEARARREAEERAQSQHRVQEEIQARPKSQEKAQEKGQAAPGNSVSSSRVKPPSPWRRSSRRRLIYQDKIPSPSEIAIEESPDREDEESSLLPSQKLAQNNHVMESTEKEMEAPETEGVPDFSADETEGQEEPEELDDPDELEALEALEEPDDVEEPEEPTRSRIVSRSFGGERVQPHEEKEEEEYSLVTQQKKGDEEPQQQKPAPPKKAGFFGGFNIMSFFSSPASLPPTDLAGNNGQAPVAATSRYVAKPGPKPRLMQSVEQAPPGEPRSALRATGLFPSIPQKEFHPSPERRTNLFSPSPAPRAADTMPDTYAGPSLSSLPPTPDFPHIAQKMNFMPQSAESRSTASLFTPSRQGTPVDQTDGSDDENEFLQAQAPGNDEQVGDSSIISEPVYERFPPRANNSRWDRNLSPTKSCLRSPLKARTPGRVVEFSANALSPSAQAQARAGGRLTVGNGNGFLPQAPLLLPPVQEDKENRQRSSVPSSSEDVNASSTTRSVLGASAPNKNNANGTRPPQRQATSRFTTTTSTITSVPVLSQTIWSKPHWVYLDQLLQQRRRDPLAFQQQHLNHHLDPRRLDHKAQQRVRSLLGKEVAAQGSSIILESWHLDIIDAFHHHVGGWEERVLAKRLFALIIGEERRRAGLRW